MDNQFLTITETKNGIDVVAENGTTALFEVDLLGVFNIYSDFNDNVTERLTKILNA